MDMTDARIIGAMNADCRTSFSALAQELGLTANAVRERVNKLVASGVLVYDVCLSYAQTGATPVLIKIATDSSVTSNNLIHLFGEHPLVYVVNPLPDGRLHLIADYRSPTELANLLQFIRTQEIVTDVHPHTLITTLGRRGEFTRDQIRVLKALLDDVRKPVTSIAQETGMTARRVTRALQKCYHEETIQFMSRWNPNLGESTAVCSEIEWVPQGFDTEESWEWLSATFPNRYWYSYVSASAPVFFSTFIVDHVREMEDIDVKLEQSGRVVHADTHFMYPSRLFPRPRRVWLEELVHQRLSQKN
jgi:DNA-binding Lrp family transcriptional regulator